jgi:hypothetical protein
MNKILMYWLVVGLAFVSCENKQKEQAKQKPDKFPVMKFDEQFYDFKELTEGDTVVHYFKFTNTGTASLIIMNATASCGCTVPTFPENPIPPGESGQIKVVFNSKNKVGMQNKTVSIYANTIPPENTVFVKGKVNEHK